MLVGGRRFQCVGSIPPLEDLALAICVLLVGYVFRGLTEQLHEFSFISAYTSFGKNRCLYRLTEFIRIITTGAHGRVVKRMSAEISLLVVLLPGS